VPHLFYQYPAFFLCIETATKLFLEAHMGRIRSVWIPIVLLFVRNSFGQITLPDNLPYKDLIFPQIAAGGEYESWVTVTNPGTVTWNGMFRFYSGKANAWNPYVNGVQIAGGALRVSIGPKSTRTYKITLPGGVESGFLTAAADDLELDNFLEGNLTYYISYGGPIADSVGIQPSVPMYSATVPFEDFRTICLAFANTDAMNRNATVRLKLFNDSNVQVGATKDIPLETREHIARYLYEIFPALSLGRGRLEISSGVPVSGMAVTLVPGSQISSLPLRSTIRNYNINSQGSEVNFARMTLWTEGLFINGYVTIDRNGARNLFAIFGYIRDGRALLHFDGDSQTTSDYGIGGYTICNELFHPDLSAFSGTYYISVPAESYIETGTFVATRVP
jgi:hypothetical protein